MSELDEALDRLSRYNNGRYHPETNPLGHTGKGGTLANWVRSGKDGVTLFNAMAALWNSINFVAERAAITEIYRRCQDLVGQITMGSTSALSFPAVDKALLSATDIVDVCVYDTRLDDRLPDGSRWNEPGRQAHTSWWNEALNTSARGAKRDFPLVALLVVTSGAVTIYDALDLDTAGNPRMWMKFNPGAGGALGIAAGTVFALNGTVWMTGQYGLYSINFPADAGYYHNASGCKRSTAPIAARNVTAGHAYATSLPLAGLASNQVNGVHARVLPGAPLDQSGLPVPTFAVATAAGTSVVHPNGTIASLAQSGGHNRVLFRDDSTLMIATAADVGVWVCPLPYTSRAIGAADTQWRPANNTAGMYPTYLPAGVGAARIAAHAIGSGVGLAITAHDTGTPTNGMVAYAATSYATGWQPGDIRLATLCDSAVGNVTGTELFPDGSFAGGSAAGWSGNGASAAVVSGVLRIATTAAFGRCSYPLATVAGQSYLVRLDVMGTSSTPAYVQVGTAPFGTDLKGAQVFAAGTPGALVEFTAGGALSYLTVGASYGGAVANVDVDNLSCRPSAADRSYKGKGLWTFGTLTRAPVAAGAEMVGWSGWSAPNYLFQPANSDLDFGTGDLHIRGVLIPATAATGWVLDHRASTANGAGYYCGITAGGAPFIAVTDGTTFAQATGAALSVGTPTPVDFIRRNGTLEIWQAGTLTATAPGASVNVSNGQGTFIGVSASGQSPFPGAIAMLRVSGYAPTPAQLRRIYGDEAALMQAGARCLLGGSSNAVQRLDRDPLTDRLLVCTDAGSSIFKGLVRTAYHSTSTITSTTSNNHKGGSLRGGTLLLGTAAQAAVLIDAIGGKEAILAGDPRPAGGGFVARGGTTDGAALDLAPRVPVGERETVMIEARFVGRVTGAADTERLTYGRRATYYRDAGGAITLQGAVQPVGTDTEVTGTADATLAIVGDWVSARVTGVSGKRIAWSATFTVTRISEETSYAA